MTKKRVKEYLSQRSTGTDKVLHINIVESINKIEVLLLSPAKVLWKDTYYYQDECISFEDSKIMGLLD